jgi:hypothetical protein
LNDKIIKIIQKIKKNVEPDKLFKPIIWDIRLKIPCMEKQ